jgi:glyoxylase-like metal-dependent hydrolase (beta-lactamase superfamily II)
VQNYKFMFKFHTIETGYFLADGGAMFGPIPKKYWSRRYPCNENNMCEMAMRSLFVETKNRKILVDTGAGDKQLDRLKFYQPHKLADIRAEISRFGYAPEDITDVVLTHLHFDHCGGSTVGNEREEIVPAFPNATYWLSRLQWENYRQPCLYEKDSFFPENIEPVFEAGQLKLIDEDSELFPGFSLRLFDGHTPGQIVVIADSESGKLIFPGDVIPSRAHMSLGWLSAFDNHAALAMDEKKRLLEETTGSSCVFIFCHDAFTPFVKTPNNDL